MDLWTFQKSCLKDLDTFRNTLVQFRLKYPAVARPSQRLPACLINLSAIQNEPSPLFPWGLKP